MHGLSLRGQALLLLLVAPTAIAAARSPWTRFVPWGDSEVYVTAVRFDRAGNVVVATSHDEVIASQLMVVSLAREDGTVRWTYRLPEPPSHGTENFVYDAAVDGRGDVVLTGFTDGMEEVQELGHRFAAIKLDGETGSVRWRADLGLGTGKSLAIDGRGDVFVSGGSYRQDEDGAVVGEDAALRKLAGLDGRVIWETGDLRPSFWLPLAVDARGDVFIDGPAAIIKFGGTRGREAWRSPAGESVQQVLAFGSGLIAHECHVDPERHVYQTHIVKRGKRDGRERWRRVYPEGPRFGCRFKIATWRHRRVFIGGTDASGVWIARLGGATGIEQWRRYFHRERDSGLESIAVGTGDEVVAHWTQGVIALSARTGDELWRVNEHTWRRHRVAVDRDGTVAFARDACIEGRGSGLVVSTFPEGASVSLPRCY